MSTYTLQITLSMEQMMALKAMGIPMSLASSAALPTSSEPAELKKEKKAKKEKDPSAPKREPSDWIKFTSRVRSVLGASMEGKTNEKGQPRKPQPKEVTQTAAALKEKGVMSSCSDADILKGYQLWLADPPATKAASAVAAPIESAVAAAPAEESKKPRKPWSEDTKKAAAEKRAAKKVSKTAVAAPATQVIVAPSDEEGMETADEGDDDILAFSPFSYKGRDYLKNLRGDVVTEDTQWVGRYDGKGVNRKFECPADLGL